MIHFSTGLRTLEHQALVERPCVCVERENGKGEEERQ